MSLLPHVLLAALLLVVSVDARAADFRRGDSNDDGAVDLSDAVCTLEYLFFQAGGVCSRRDCLSARDTDDDGAIDLSDPIRLLNFLFLGAPPPPEPFRSGCGQDPTPDSLGCASSDGCSGAGSRVLAIEDVELFSIWSEAYTTLDEQHAIHSRVRLRGGEYRLPEEGVVDDVGLVARVESGPLFENLEPLDGGRWTVVPEEFFPFRYRQSFVANGSVWSFVLQYRPDDTLHETIDCSELDGRSLGGRLVFWAELGEAEGDPRRVWLSCFDAEVWMPARGASPRRITLENSAEVEIEIEEVYFFRGVAGETSNRRMSRGIVELSAERRIVEDFAHLVYAGKHHNSEQEYRILFDEPIGDVYGIDLIDCPPGVGNPFFCYVPTTGESLAYTLDATLERSAPLTVTDWVIGN